MAGYRTVQFLQLVKTVTLAYLHAEVFTGLQRINTADSSNTTTLFDLFKRPSARVPTTWFRTPVNDPTGPVVAKNPLTKKSFVVR